MDRIEEEKFALTYDETVAPVWGVALGSLLLDTVTSVGIPARSSSLVAGCRTGWLPANLLPHICEGSRVIAVDSSGDMLDLARRKLHSRDRKRVFFATQPLPRLNYADNVFHATLCDNGFVTVDELAVTLNELYRVTRSGGVVGIAFPLRGTFTEFYDLFREALLIRALEHLEESLDAHLASHLTVESVEALAVSIGLTPLATEYGEFDISFENGDDYLFSPFVEQSYLPLWLNICTEDTTREAIFYTVLKSLNTYFDDIDIVSSVPIGALVGMKK